MKNRTRVHSITRDLSTVRWSITADAGDPRDRLFTARRPWGHFDQLVSNAPVSVKIITVEPGRRLSLQRHSQRGELWCILDVPMDVLLEAGSWRAAPGETVWVPRGAVHRLGNPGSTPGRVLEVAFGTFDEDDIERLADDYARGSGKG